MGAGKVFCILGGILTIVATFLFSFAHTGILSYYYIGLFLDLASVFQSGELIWIVMMLVFIVIMLSGILILLGVKSRAASIVGSLLAIILAMYFILTLYDIIPNEIGQYINVFAEEALIDDLIPFEIPLGGGTSGIEVSLGTYLMLGGGILGLIGGIMGPSGY